MAQTAKYCEECSREFYALPVDRQNEKQQEFLKAGKLKISSEVVYAKTVKIETGTCEECGQVKDVLFYPL